MSQEFAADEAKALRSLSEWVRARYREGKTQGEIINQLQQSGYSASFSTELTSTIISDMVAEAEIADRDPMGDFAVAALATGIGGGITYATFASADAGGTFLIFYGPAVFGGWKLLQGIAKFIWTESPDDARRPAAIGMGLVAVAVTALSIAALTYSISNSQSTDNATTESTSRPGNTTIQRPFVPPTKIDESLADLKAGDCFIDPGTTEIEKLDLVPCSTSNASRVTNTFQIKRHSVYPSSTAMDEIADAQCSATATWYIGPTRESWAAGDRLIACISD